MKHLIVNADDFGLSRDVSLAIVDSFKAGSITSTTLMVNMAGADHAAELAQETRELEVGLHFNLTLGRPVAAASAVPSLVDSQGRFLGRRRLAPRVLARRVRWEHVAKELGAQLRRFEELGLRPSHIDSHEHVHTFPLVFDAVAGVCARRRLPMRVPWLRGQRNLYRRPGRAVRRRLLSGMLRRNRASWEGRVAWNTEFGSIFDLNLAARDLELSWYRHLLETAGEGVFELMVHPVRNAHAVEELTRIGPLSEAEWAILSQPGLDAIGRELGFHLTGYSRLFSESLASQPSS